MEEDIQTNHHFLGTWKVQGSDPHWKRIYIQFRVPQEIRALEKLADNVWWSWNKEAQALFRDMDPELWEQVGYNPKALLDRISYEKYQELKDNRQFKGRLDSVESDFDKYMKDRRNPRGPKIAYFCMEYGLHSSIKLYSGGLGVLAGDYLKEASDSAVNMVGVGLLYRYGYFRQGISLHGDQIAHFDPQRFTYLPVEPVRDQSGNWIRIDIDFPDRIVYAKCWKIKVGSVNLYLLDTDIEENKQEDRPITHQLYGGDRENRLKQEVLLGVGGIRMLEAIGFRPDIYHMNEGHAAFIGLERLQKLVKNNDLDFPEAVEVVKSSTLFTTHTPVAAGHDRFHPDLTWHYWGAYGVSMDMDREDFLAIGREDPNNEDEEFSMSHVALRLSQEVNGVSQIHGNVSRGMFNNLFPGYEADELYIGHVTNSIHNATWVASEWQELFENKIGNEIINDPSDSAAWQKIYHISDKEIHDIRQTRKRKLIEYLKGRLGSEMKYRGESPTRIFEMQDALREDALIFGFARRFASYKRAQLLFYNPDRLLRIIENAPVPVQFIFAGKAHPADGVGQGIIKHIYEVAHRPEFFGKVIFLEDYNMELARHLVQGVDVWLNTPTRPLEASGTSGMKANANGVLNFSVLDGWWAEGYKADAGWALPEEKTYDNQDLQNEMDAEYIYSTIEEEIIPEFAKVNDKGISNAWILRIKNALATIAPRFTMRRMLDEYFEKYYNKLYQRNRSLKSNNFEKARNIAAWKERVVNLWDHVEIKEVNAYDTENKPLPLGSIFKASIVLDLKDLKTEEISMEILFARKKEDGYNETFLIKELNKQSMKPAEANGVEGQNLVRFSSRIKVPFSGVYEYGFRFYAKNKMLPHRQDFNLVKWV